MSQPALAITAAGLVSALAVVLGTRSWRTALVVLTEFLTAAGLVRLAGAPTWTQLATAAIIVVVRRMVVTSLRGQNSGAPARPERDTRSAG